MKKWVRHFSLLLLELLGAALAAALVLACLLAWRLSEGPLRLHTLEPYVVAGLGQLAAPYNVKLSETAITWGRDRTSLGLRATDVEIYAPDGRRLASVPEVEIDLSVPALLLGRPAPKLIRLIGTDLRLVRSQSGQLQLSLASEAATTPSAESESGLLQGWLDTLADEPKSSSMVGALRAVEIENARLTVDDFQYGVRWQAPRANLAFARDTDGMRGTLDLEVAMGAARSHLLGRLLYERRSGDLKARLELDGFNPAQLASWSPAFAELTKVNVPLRGHLVVRWVRALGLAQAEFDLAAGKGELALQPEQPAVGIEYAKLSGRIDRQAQSAEISDLYIDLGGPKVKLLAGATREGDIVKVLADASIEAMSAAELERYWPPFIAKGARRWVTKNIVAGRVPKASAQARLDIPLSAPKAAKVTSVTGTMTLADMTVHYFRPLPPVTNGQGSAVFDRENFNITVASGQVVQEGVSPIKVSSALIKLQGLAEGQDRADIELTTTGKLSSQLVLLDNDRLGYPRRLGINAPEAIGEATVSARLQFPLLRELPMDLVAISASADLHKVGLPKLVAGQDLSEGELNLDLDGGGMRITGTGKVGPASVKDILWVESFVPDVSPNSEIRFSGVLNEEGRKAFRVSWPDVVADNVAVSGQYTKDRGQPANLALTLDFTPATLALPWFGWYKPVGQPASGTATVTIDKRDVTAIPGFTLQASKVDVKGKVDFALGSKWQKVTLDALAVPGSQVKGSISNKAEAGLQLNLKGPVADISGIFDEAKVATVKTEPVAGAAPAAPPALLPLDITYDIKKIITGAERYLQGPPGRLVRSDQGWTLLDVTGRMNGKTPMQIQLLPTPKGRSFVINSEDAGQMLKTIRLMESIQGGRIGVVGDGAATGPITAKLELTNFKYLNAATLQKLASAASQEGADKLAKAEGVDFKKLKAKFDYAESSVKVRDAKMSGDLLGLSLAGNIDLRSSTLDLSGTVVPLYGLNSAVSGIPIIGWLLTGGEGGGVFAAAYTLKGPLKDPQTSVNPLSILTPGFLRELFFVDSK
jgi:hypothetical protein